MHYLRFLIVFAWILTPSFSQGQTADSSAQTRQYSTESVPTSSAQDRCLLSYAKDPSTLGATVGIDPVVNPFQPALAASSASASQPATGFEQAATAPQTRLQWCQSALNQQTLASTKRAMLQATLAGLFLNEGDLVNAQMQLNAALETNAEHFLVQANLGNLRLHERAFSEAVSAYSTALQGPLNEQDRGAVYFNRALALRAQGDYAGAQADYAAYRALQTTQHGISPLMTDDTSPSPTAQSDPSR